MVHNNFTPALRHRPGRPTRKPPGPSTPTPACSPAASPRTATARSCDEDGVQRITSTVYTPTCPGLFDPNTCNAFTGATPLHSIRTVTASPAQHLLRHRKHRLQPHDPPRTGSSPPTTTSRRSGTTPAPKTSTLPPTISPPARALSRPISTSFSGSPPAGATATSSSLASATSPSSTSSSSSALCASTSSTTPTTTTSPLRRTPAPTPASTPIRTGNPLWNVFGNATSTSRSSSNSAPTSTRRATSHYNITTGFDNNGDGDFNDRPQYAPAGTPLCTAAATANCAYATQFGLLVTSGGTEPTLRRNKGILPWTIYLDTNLQRTFKLTRNPKADHPQSLTANIRSLQRPQPPQRHRGRWSRRLPSVRPPLRRRQRPPHRRRTSLQLLTIAAIDKE